MSKRRLHTGSLGVVAVQHQILDLTTLFGHDLGHDKRRVVGRSRSPLPERRLIAGRRREEVVELADTTIVKKDLSNTDRRGLEGEVNQVKGCSEGVGCASETTTGSGIGFEYCKDLSARMHEGGTQPQTHRRSPCQRR